MNDKPKRCNSCQRDLVFAGTKAFRTGGGGGLATFFFGAFAEASEDLLPLALYGCAGCGRVELFVPSAAAGEGG